MHLYFHIDVIAECANRKSTIVITPIVFHKCNCWFCKWIRIFTFHIWHTTLPHQLILQIWIVDNSFSFVNSVELYLHFPMCPTTWTRNNSDKSNLYSDLLITNYFWKHFCKIDSDECTHFKNQCFWWFLFVEFCKLLQLHC